MNNIEFHLQKKVCEYLSWQYPTLFFFSDLSGISLPIGLAKKIKPLKSRYKNIDLFICAKNKEFSGLFIEFKKSYDEIYTIKGEFRKNEHLTEQLKTKYFVESQGFKHEFCYDFDKTKNIIDKYLSTFCPF